MKQKVKHRYLIGAIEDKNYLFPPKEEIIHRFLVKAYSRRQAIFLLKLKFSKKKILKITFSRDLGEYTADDAERDRRFKLIFKSIEILKTEKRKIELDLDLYGGISISTVNQYNSRIEIHFYLDKATNQVKMDRIILLERDRLEDEAEGRLTDKEWAIVKAIAEKYLKRRGKK